MSVNYDCLEVLVANLMGMVLLLGMLYTSKWRIHVDKREVNYLRILVYTVALCAFADIFTRLYDGLPGSTARVIVYVTNYWIFFAGYIGGLAWFMFMLVHIYGAIENRARNCLILALSIASIPMFLNFFFPVIFYVDASNTYRNGDWYLFYPISLFLILIVVEIFCVREKRRLGSREFFPPILFALPIIFGFFLQQVFPKVSAVIPCVCIAAGFLMYSLQNELAYTDQLTGLNNRFYLNLMIQDSRHRRVTVFLMDLNGFKAINDRFGHNQGDIALRDFARILAETAVGRGKAIRYAGDEFLIILYTQEEKEVESFIHSLQSKIEEYNQSYGKLYTLSTAYGYAAFDLQAETPEDMMNVIDKRMYQNKQEYYDRHPELIRRSGSYRTEN